MTQINLIQTYYKGFSCYLPETKKNLVLRDILELLVDEKNLTDHYFIYFDDRLGRGFRIFLQTEHSSESLQNKFSSLLKTYDFNTQNPNLIGQFFKTYPPFSVVPMKFINEHDEILTSKDKIQSVQNLLKNLSSLIVQKMEEFDFGNDNQKLEFTLELLIAGVAFNQFSSLSIEHEFKLYLKQIPGYKKYLEDKYASTIEQSKDDIAGFKKSLILAKNNDNVLTLFWRNNHVENSRKVFEITFKVLNINVQQKCYCLYVLQNT